MHGYQVTLLIQCSYTVTWQRAHSDVDLAGVEYKSLPSGLHEEDSDVVYYAHGALSGISAYIQTGSDAEHRNARSAAVGTLSVQHDGSSTPAWQYSGPLNRLARTVIQDLDDYTVLEEYWARANKASHIDAPRADAVVATPSIDADLPDAHPVRSLARTFELFGPLLYPVQRQALLAKRLLIVGSPPVQENCDHGMPQNNTKA